MLIAAICFSFSSELSYLPNFQNKIEVAHYDSHSKQHSTITTFAEPHLPGNKTIEISGDFVIDNPEGSLYMDLFQTSSVNEGLRFEIGKTGDATYNSALVLNSKASKNGAMTYALGGPPYVLHPHQVYHFDFKISQNKSLHYELFTKNGDDLQLAFTPSTSGGDFSDYQIHDILIGAGFDNTRKFNGTMDHFAMKYTYYTPTTFDQSAGSLACLFLLGALLITGLNNPKKMRTIVAKRDLKYFLLVPMIFAYPILELYAVNLLNIPLLSMLKIVSRIVLFSIVLYSLLFYAYKNAAKAFLAAVISAVVLLFIGRIYDSLSHLLNPDIFLFTLALVLIASHFVLIHLQNISAGFNKILSSAVCLLFVMSILMLGYNSIKIALATGKIAHNPLNLTSAKPPTDQPDIYFIISDMHASRASMKKYLGYGNSKFYQQLQSLGFYVASNAASNYKFTNLSIPSMLNLDYIPKEVNDLPKIHDYYDHNQMARVLKKLGYQFIFISPRRYVIEKSHIADANLTCSKISDFEGILWSYSLFFRTNILGDTYRNDIICGINNIKKSVTMPGPKFVFAHLLSPHPPYVFDKLGKPVPYENQKDLKISTTRTDLNKAGYLGQAQFISKKLLDVVKFILANSKKTPIIIIQGDHGFSLYETSEFGSGKEMPPEDNINARMRPLAAYLFPNGGNKVLYDTITPVNMTRGLMRYYFQQNQFTKLADKAYWSPDVALFHFTDVTRIIRKQDK